MKTSFFFTAFLAIAATSAFGQDTQGVNQTGGQAGTVIKGKAPVTQDLLKVKFPKPKQFKLSNGIMVYLLEDHRAPAVRFSLQMRTGSAFEPKPGVAAMTASMLTEGTQTLTGDQITEEEEDWGANISANSGLDTTTITTACLSDSVDKALGLMADMLFHPAFPSDGLEREKFGRRGGMSGRVTNPTMAIAELTNQVFYGGTKLARPNPSRQDLQAIQVSDLQSFYSAYYHPNGAIIGITGDITPAAAQKLLEASLGAWKAAESVPDLTLPSLKEKSQAHILLIDRPNSAQTVLQFGTLAVSQTDPDFIALTVANRILGGGSSGRLFQNIRERKGYTYGAYSTLAASRWPAVWGANASVRTEVTEPAIGEFFAEFKRLQDETVPEAELEQAKRSIIGGFALALQSPEGILGRTLEQVQNGLPSNYWDTYPSRIEAVTAADVQRVARKYLGGSNVQLLVVGERSKIETGLAKYGSVETVDPQKISSVTVN